MLQTKIIMIFCVILTTSAFAVFPFDDLWMVRLESGSALGNAWTDEDGNTMLLVGDDRRAKLISNQEIIWESDQLIGPVTALIRIPYADGEQFIVAASEPLREPERNEGREILGYGHLYRFGGDDHELVSDMQLLTGGRDYDDMIETHFEYDNRNLVKLAILPEMLEDREHPVLAAWDTYTDYYEWWLPFVGHSGILGVITDEVFDIGGYGYVGEIEIRQDANENSMVVFGWSSRGWTHFWDERGFVGGVSCGVRLFDADLDRINSVVLTYFSDDLIYEYPSGYPEMLGMEIMQEGDEHSLLVAFSDSTSACIANVSLPDLEVRRRRMLPSDWQGGQMIRFQWTREEDVISTLMLIDSRGNALFLDAESLDEIEGACRYFGHIASRVIDNGGDDNPALLVLTRNHVKCLSFAPVGVLPDQFIPQPSSLTLSEPYPNPFNAQTNIEYQVPETGNVSIRLYDLKGQQVAELVNESHAAGQYDVVFNAPDLASGVYLVRMVAGVDVQSRKVVLMR